MPVLLKSLQEIGDEFPTFENRELQEMSPQEQAGYCQIERDSPILGTKLACTLQRLYNPVIREGGNFGHTAISSNSD
jgi:hypothetical protein